MKIILDDAASACIEVTAEDISCVEDCLWLTTLMQYLEYQYEYWGLHRHYAEDLESLVRDI